MKNFAITLIALLLLSGYAFSQNNGIDAKAKFSSFTDSASYAYGIVIAKSIESLRIDFNQGLIIQALKDVKNKTAIYNDTLTNSLMKRLQNVVQTNEKARIEDLTKENAYKTKAFFEENAKKPNVKKTASGLQYEELISGPLDGMSPSINDTAVVNYEARFINGQIFDTTFETGKPVHIPLNQIIPGLQEGLLMMKPKDSFILYIPSELAYGEKGAPSIEPNQGLIFKIDMIEIIKGSAPIQQY